jgi:hypothetical protein
MPLSLDEILAAYAEGAAEHRSRKALAAEPARLWQAVHDPRPKQIGSVQMRDSARRQWAVDVRRDHRGRYLQVRPIGVDIERFRASADGWRPDEWLPIPAQEWTAFALFAAGAHDGSGHREDGELALAVPRLLDRMVREAQHRGLAFDEDED